MHYLLHKSTSGIFISDPIHNGVLLELKQYARIQKRQNNLFISNRVFIHKLYLYNYRNQ